MTVAIHLIIYVAIVGAFTWAIAAVVKQDVGSSKLTLYVWAVCFAAAGSVTSSLAKMASWMFTL
jgi:hypothetical protein